ncbi:hypothetical protein KVL92_03900 [Helicobacter pylori]|nr:hypothetical protein KVL92_03900 [Helicobacter pylori]
MPPPMINNNNTTLADLLENGEPTIRNGFGYEWGSLYPITEKEKLETDNMKMNLLMGARELGANTSDLNQELQKMNIFSTNMDLMNTDEYNDLLKDEQNTEALKQSNSI